MPAFQAPPRAQSPETIGRSPGESQTDQRRLSRGHARRLRAPTQAAPLWAWKLKTKRGDRRWREAITDGRGLLLRLSFLVRGGPRCVSGLRRVRKPQPRFRRGGEADACRTGSAANPWCRCKRASSAACRGQATWSMSSPAIAEPALLALAPRRQHPAHRGAATSAASRHLVRSRVIPRGPVVSAVHRAPLSGDRRRRLVGETDPQTVHMEKSEPTGSLVTATRLAITAALGASCSAMTVP
jgi:hypothetical protein